MCVYIYAKYIYTLNLHTHADKFSSHNNQDGHYYYSHFTDDKGEHREVGLHAQAHTAST